MEAGVLRSGKVQEWPVTSQPTVATDRKDASYDRWELCEELLRRFDQAGLKARIRFLWKKYAWLLTVRGAGLVKRLADIVVTAGAFLVLAPLLVLVALLIKTTDRGPVLFWQRRVGLCLLGSPWTGGWRPPGRKCGRPRGKRTASPWTWTGRWLRWESVCPRSGRRG